MSVIFPLVEERVENSGQINITQIILVQYQLIEYLIWIARLFDAVTDCINETFTHFIPIDLQTFVLDAGLLGENDNLRPTIWFEEVA